MRVNEIVSASDCRIAALTASFQLNTAERIDAGVIATNVAALLSCFALYLCLPNPYHKALDALWRFLASENAEYYERKGVQFQNPACNGLTHLDVLVRSKRAAGKRKDADDDDDELELETAASSEDAAAAAAPAAAVSSPLPLSSSDSDAPLLASSSGVVKKERRRKKK